MGKKQDEQEIRPNLVFVGWDHQGLLQRLAARLGYGKNLLIRAFFLSHFGSPDHSGLVQRAQRRVDGAKTGGVNMTEGSFLEGLFDLISGRVAPVENA